MWVNSILKIIEVNSFWLGDLQLIFKNYQYKDTTIFVYSKDVKNKSRNLILVYKFIKRNVFVFKLQFRDIKIKFCGIWNISSIW